MLESVGVNFRSKGFFHQHFSTLNRYSYFRSFIALFLIGFVFVALPASAAVVVTAKVEARVIPSLSASAVESLNFGNLSAGSSPGEIIISPDDGDRKSSGGVKLRNSSIVRPAAVRVLGTPNATYSITLPSSISLTSEKGYQMPVTGFTLSKDSGRINDTGMQLFKIGGTLKVAPHQKTGDYSGVLSLTLDYN